MRCPEYTASLLRLDVNVGHEPPHQRQVSEVWRVPTLAEGDEVQGDGVAFDDGQGCCEHVGCVQRLRHSIARAAGDDPKGLLQGAGPVCPRHEAVQHLVKEAVSTHGCKARIGVDVDGSSMRLGVPRVRRQEHLNVHRRLVKKRANLWRQKKKKAGAS